jgi:NADH-quinone oxidoreductase subunit N
MIFANHLLLFFVGLELLSIPLYILTGLGQHIRRCSEAAFKYFFLGSIASALFIYGTALTWGNLGTFTISSVGSALRSPNLISPSLTTLGLALILAGVAFKIGLAPFQMWVPDVYEGAPTTVAAWMAGAVKASIFAVAIRIFGSPFLGGSYYWAQVVTVLAIASMLWGSLGALIQTDVRRLLGYSAIAHAGYSSIALVVAMGGAWREAGAALSFYMLAYGIAALSAFVILSIEEDRDRLKISDLSGLAQRKPLVAFALAICFFSLAGLPPLGGFLAKFNVFVLAARGGHYGLVIVAVLTSVVSLAYYLKVLVSAVMQKPIDLQPIRVHFGTAATLGLAVLLMVVLGVLPSYLIDFLFQLAD